ncbi:hypothetical protein [Pseudomonas sp. CGJS7]|uniref:hypothetical protein n=1 Tax=Pseudomonas sp. CGJS7 TaxID=3109348 RepID=UPI0030095424
MKRLALVLIALGLSFQAAAATVSNAKITVIRVDSSGLGMITFDKPLDAPAACIHPAYTASLSFDATTPGGKAILATAIAAKNANSTISSAYGTGACGNYGGSWVEDLSYFHVN